MEFKMKKNVILLILLMMIFTAAPVSANSAVRWWKGSDTGGSYLLDEDCPVVCEHEDLLFEIYEFPERYYRDPEEFTSIKSSVEASYTLHNPTDEKLEVRLVFPFGELPYYTDFSSYEINDLSGYSISKNDEPLEYRVRYTYSSGSFNVYNELKKLQDDYLENDRFTADLKVYEYTYKAKGEYEAKDGLVAKAEIISDPSNWKMISVEQYSLTDGKLTLSYDLDDEKKEYTFYVIGEDLEQEPLWSIENNEDIKIELVKKNETVLKDFLLSHKEDENISDVDWYNACLTFLDQYKDNNVIGSLFKSVNSSLMLWLEYTLDFGPQETLNNKVKVLIYPDVDEGYDPTMYSYRYLVSPASTWADFKDLDITIRTDYFLIDSDEAQEFKKNGNDYTAHYDQLPADEINFRLNSSAEPQRSGGSYSSAITIFILAVLAIGGLLLLLILFLIIKGIIKLIRKKNK